MHSTGLTIAGALILIGIVAAIAIALFAVYARRRTVTNRPSAAPTYDGSSPVVLSSAEIAAIPTAMPPTLLPAAHVGALDDRLAALIQ